MDRFTRLVTAAFVVVSLCVVGFAFLPLSDVASQLWYDAVASASIALGLAGVIHYRPPRRAGWLWILGGMATWVVGDLVWSVEQFVVHVDRFPAVSDAFYLAGYLALAAGTMLMIRTRRGGRDVTALLDALIVASGAAVLVATFVIAPLATDSSLSTPARLVSTFYPVADLVLLAILARLWTTPGARTLSYALLTGSIGLTLLVDLSWNIWVFADNEATGAGAHSMDVAWLVGYVLAGAAAAVPSMRTLAEPPPDREDVVATPRRLLPLAAGLMLPAVVLLVDGMLSGDVLWPVIGIGMLALCVLVLVRMAGLLRIVQDQALRLDAVARSDALTGAPNRRTWDHELTRACATSRTTDSPLSVAMLDMDWFKAFNDTFGHQAGDRLLREAVAVWSDALGPEVTLARYGGEEFAVLLPGMTVDEAVRRIEALRPLTPQGQSFSAGVSLWDPVSDPASAVARADEALYHAKRTGRDRVVAYTTGTAVDTTNQLPAFRIVLQPVVDLRTHRIVGHEALARFDDASADIEQVFRRAHRHGYGDLLETATLCAALELAERPDGQFLYVNVSPATLASARFWEALPERLDGVVVELTEIDLHDDESALAVSVVRLRGRGARIALDDLGAGRAEFSRLALLQPDIVKVDRSIVDGCATHAGRSAVLRALVTYAQSLEVTVCAEGVEDRADLDHLRALGVDQAQGYLLGRPAPAWTGHLVTLVSPSHAESRPLPRG